VLPPVYAILDLDSVVGLGRTPESVAAAWLDAGIRLIQLRAKSAGSGAMLELADRLAGLAREAGATFIVNDRVDIARLSGASGVHVGQQDLSPIDAARLLPPPFQIGLSTHNQAQLEAAVLLPLDLAYVAIGPVFATRSKAQPDPTIGVEGVRLARRIAGPRGWPVVAIGGITLARASEVIEAGATSVAVISDLLGDDPAGRARAFLSELGSGRVI
jgi:thiamine-phosphate pyrophosphorylase